MKTYLVTVVRMVECVVLVEARSIGEAKHLAITGRWMDKFYEETVGVEVVGEPEEVE